MSRITAVVLAVLALAAITAGVAFAVSGTSQVAAPVVESSGAAAGRTAISAVSNPIAVGPGAAVPLPAVAKPLAVEPETTTTKPKSPKTVTGAVVHDPDDCGDTCTDSQLDSDDCVMDDCADDVKPVKASGVSPIDDDGDGDGGDCGDADGE
jgi:hypothetical protein